MVRLVERLVERIESDDEAGEPPLLPILNRHKPVGSTADVDFKTVKPYWPTSRRDVNQVVLDTATWEQSAATRSFNTGPAVPTGAHGDAGSAPSGRQVAAVASRVVAPYWSGRSSAR